MSLEIKSGQTVKLTLTATPTRAAARKTLERLFLTDKSISKPRAARARNFKDKPKRRGGALWTQHPNKPDLNLAKGSSATVTLTPQFIKDVNSVADFVQVANA